MSLLPPVIAEFKATISDFTSKLGEVRADVAKTADANASKFDKFKSAVGGHLTAVGGFATGAGAILEHLGNQAESARVMLEQSLKDAGFSFEDYKKQIGSVDSKMEGFAHSNADTEEALSKLTTALGDPTKALNDMQLVADLAAVKHESLTAAATAVAKAHGGAAKLFKEFGIVVQKNADGTKNMQGALDELSRKIAGQASASVSTFGGKIDVLKTKFMDIAAHVGEKVGPALVMLGPVLMGVGTLISSGVIPPILAATAAALPWIAAIAAVAAAAYLIVENWSTIVDFFQALPGKILDFLKGLPDLLVDLGKKLLGGLWDGIQWYAENVLYTEYVTIPLKLVEWLGDLGSLLLDAGKKLLGGLLAGIKWVATTGLYDYFIGLPKLFIGWIGDASRWLLTVGGDLATGIWQGLVNTEGKIMGWITGLPGKIVGWLGNAGTWLFDTGKDMLRGLVKGVEAVWNKLADVMSFTIGGGSFLGVSLPSFDVHLLPHINWDIPGLAAGGVNIPGGRYLVGERGPEIVDIPKGSNVTPNNQIGNAGGVHFENHFYNTNTTDAVVREQQWMLKAARLARAA